MSDAITLQHACETRVVTLPNPLKSRLLERAIKRTTHDLIEKLGKRLQGPIIVEDVDTLFLGVEEAESLCSILVTVVARKEDAPPPEMEYHYHGPGPVPCFWQDRKPF